MCDSQGVARALVKMRIHSHLRCYVNGAVTRDQYAKLFDVYRRENPTFDRIYTKAGLDYGTLITMIQNAK